MSDQSHNAAQPQPSAPSSSHLVLLEDAEGFPRGAIAPNEPGLAAKLGSKARPATAFDLGVAGIVTRELR